MATLQIEHPITDYDTWRRAFDAMTAVRRKAGVVSGRVARPIDNPRFIVVALDFDSTERATEFLHFLEANVWTSVDSAPALSGRPKTVILEMETAPIV